MTIEIECLFAPGCGARQETLNLVERLVRELGLSPNIREIFLNSPEEVAKYNFLGSPSLRVNGSDIEPGADDRTDFGLG